MAVGQGALIGGLSYVAIGRETTLGTYTTATSSLDVLSASMTTMKDNKILEQIERSRTYSKRISLSKKIEGDLEFYYSPTVDAANYILQNAFGGTVTSATATGETVGAGASSAMVHTFNIGSMDQSYTSICINLRKGDSTNGKVFQYSGVRVNEVGFSAELDEALKCNVGLIGMDSTQVSNDVSSVLSTNAGYSVLSFVDGRVSVETSFASLTSTSFWHVQGVEFGWSNSLKADSDSRRIGSDLLTILPPGIASLTLKCKIRFDTTTAYSAMLNATKLSAQLEFLGPTLSGSSIRQGLKLNYPTLYINNSGDPEIGGPDEILSSEVEFHVLRDDTTTTGYAVQALVTNQKTSYS
jgi:hypothetical protein